MGSSHLVEESWSCPIVWLRPKVKLNWLDIEMEFTFTRTILPKKTMSHCFYSHVPLLPGRPIVGEGGVKAMVENGIVEEGRPCQIPLLSSSMRTIRKIEIDLAYFRKKENVLLIYIIEISNNFDKILLLLISHSYSAFDISLPTSICG